MGGFMIIILPDKTLEIVTAGLGNQEERLAEARIFNALSRISVRTAEAASSEANEFHPINMRTHRNRIAIMEGNGHVMLG